MSFTHLTKHETLMMRETKKNSEWDCTITKLQTQVDIFAKNIEGKIMLNNIHLIYHQIEKDIKKECDVLLSYHGKIADEEYLKRADVIRKKQACIRQQKIHRSNGNGHIVLNEDEKFITLDDFIDNLNHVDEETKELFIQTNDYGMENLVEIKPEIKICYDILPILNTMMDMLKKINNEK